MIAQKSDLSNLKGPIPERPISVNIKDYNFGPFLYFTFLNIA